MNTQQALEAYQKHQKYMQAYNQRPEVRAKRREYNSRRWQALKAAAALVKQEKV